jgi:hypothetical protein
MNQGTIAKIAIATIGAAAAIAAAWITSHGQKGQPEPPAPIITTASPSPTTPSTTPTVSPTAQQETHGPHSPIKETHGDTSPIIEIHGGTTGNINIGNKK